MQVDSLDALEADPKGDLDRILVARDYPSALDDEDRLPEYVEALVREEGYFALSGRTPPLLERMIWTKNDVTTQSVELTDGV